MNGVIGVAELLADTALDPEQRDYVATIVESGRALLTIINDVLDLSKLEAGRMDLAQEDFDLAVLVGRSIELMRPVAQGRGLWLEAELPPSLPRHRGDPGRLRQVVLNLLGNAVKFTETGGVRLRLDWLPGEHVDRIDLHVEDTGIGIPPERQAQVFDSFAQADNTIGRRFGGTGLGLTISRELVRCMGGDISLVSAPGHGSTFTISLPLTRAETVTAADPLAGPEAPRTSLRLLVAEDNRTNALIVRRLLEPCVASFHAAEEGAAAVALWEAERPDLILMDVSMPGMDGLEATRVIRAAEARAGLPRVPIFALTAYSDVEHQAAFIAAGMDGALTKPFLRAELFTLLRHVAGLETAPPPQQEPSGFDLSPGFAVDREAKGEAAWSISQHGCITTIGKSTRSSGR